MPAELHHGRERSTRHGSCWLPRFLIIALSALFIQLVCASSNSPPALLLQLSDLHVSTTEDQSRLTDLVTLSEEHLSAILPDAVMLSGDLVHSKVKPGVAPVGKQVVDEWKGYRQAVDHLVAVTGVPLSAILDVRGNHDAFDVGCASAETAAADFFSEFASLGNRHTDSESRVQVRQVIVNNKLTGTSVCPSAVIVAIDASPVCKLRAPINFSGVASQSLLLELEAKLGQESATTAQALSNCTKPPVIAFSHYPFSVVRYPRPLSASAPPQDAATLPELLSRHGCTAYLSGHLHATFGQRLHRLHPPAAPYGAARQEPLMELETASWKYERRFRFLTVDEGRVSFVDLEFVPPRARQQHSPQTCTHSDDTHSAKGEHDTPPRGAIRAVDPSRTVGDWLVLITAPLDGRYSSGKFRAELPTVRALLLPTSRAIVRHAGATEQSIRPEACWGCVTGDPAAQCISMERIHGGIDGSRLLFQTHPHNATVACRNGGHLTLQVVVKDVSAHQSFSCSEKRWVGVEGSTPPLQPPVTLVEYVVLHVDWPLLGWYAMPLVGMFLLVGMLILPRLLSKVIIQMGDHRQGSIARGFIGLLVTPLALLSHSAVSNPGAWALQVVYASWLLSGPWIVGTLYTGAPPGLVTMWGVILLGSEHLPNSECGTLPGGGGLYCPNPDVIFYILPQYLLLLLPGTLWLAMALQAKFLGRDFSCCPLRCSCQWFCGAMLLLVYLRLVWRLWIELGPLATVLSPGVSWSLPLAVCALAMTSPPTRPYPHKDSPSPKGE